MRYNHFNLFVHQLNVNYIIIFITACSRSIDTINKLLKEDSYSIKRARCLANGDYDSLQCINKRCMCVNEIDGSLADPKKAPVYISLTSELPCCMSLIV